MTYNDGIIQKVFNKYLESGEFKNNYIITNRKLIEIQQELIAEIEKKFANKNVEKFTCSIFSLVELRRLLIGDNQEYDDKLSEDDFED